MTHVFVVDDKTFKCHLENMFAGTGAGEKQSPFLINANYQNTKKNANGTTAPSESGLVSMISDISKVQRGDKIIFYLQATKKHQGMFFGVFQAKSSAFFDEANNQNYLYTETEKYLTYRILIEPFKVFEQGITEHEYLDKLTGKKTPYELCWTLIYRKLKGNRGCTTITDHEYQDLINKLEQKNNWKFLKGTAFTYESNSFSIALAKSYKPYTGRQDSIDIANRLIYKMGKNYAFESHLQAYVIQNINNTHFNKLLKPLPNTSYWLGNEVACGVGMQRMDILLIQEDIATKTVYFKIIELKDESPYEETITNQLPWYLEWLNDYIVPHYASKKIKIIPCVIANGKPSESFKKTAQTAKFSIACEPLEYIGYALVNGNIVFSKYF